MDTSPDIRPSADPRYPMGPGRWSRFLGGKGFRQDPLAIVTENAQQYGDLVHFTNINGHIYQFNHPALIQEIMVVHERENRRVLTMQRARVLLGDGLLTSEEPLHMRQGRMAAPAFHRERIAAYGEVIGKYAEQVVGRWQPGEMDVHPQMLLLALRIVGKCLFNIEEKPQAQQIAAAVQAFMVTPPPPWVPMAVLTRLQRLPFGPMKRAQQGIDHLDSILYGLIAERRKSPGDRGDLLSMLLGAEDAEALTDADRQMSDKQVRDECLTVLLAGHETTANALSFTLWLLAKHPELQDKAHAEAADVLGSRTSTAADYPKLAYLYKVFAEYMRLMPTVWALGRSCGPEGYSFHGFTIPPEATLLAPQFVVHRDPRFWSRPEEFDRNTLAKTARRAGQSSFTFPLAAGRASASAKAWPGWKVCSHLQRSCETGVCGCRPAHPRHCPP